MGTLCTECRKPVDEPMLCWDGGAFEGEPIHEGCIDSARERMFNEAAQMHRDLIASMREQIDRLYARLNLPTPSSGQEE